MKETRRPSLSLLSLIALLFISTSGPAEAVIYGDDDRTEYYQATATQQGAAGSVAALVWASNIDASDPTDVKFYGPTLAEYQNLCDTERFKDQKVAGFCSGTLIDDDLILTAGHCITNASECAEARFVFGYQYDASGVPRTITVDDIYECQEIVAREYSPDADYAIVQLDRPATPLHSPAPVRRGGLLEFDPNVLELIVVGHPNGILTKIAGGAEVKGAFQDYFETNVDAFGGNSGSGVVNSSGVVEGILVRGNDDWVWNEGGSCWESNVCPSVDCDGYEDVTRITNTLVPGMVPESCGDGLCDPGEDEITCPADCPQDSDYDLAPDETDNCPRVPNPTQDNFDGDPYGDACDCDFANGDIWTTPGEGRDLLLTHDIFSGWTTLVWSPPLEPGAVAVVYDTIRTDFPWDYLGPASCIRSDSPDLFAEDLGDPPINTAFYYLVRAENGCPDGQGPLGPGENGAQRVGRNCP